MSMRAKSTNVRLHVEDMNEQQFNQTLQAIEENRNTIPIVDKNGNIKTEMLEH